MRLYSSFGFSRNCKLIKDSSLWHSNFILIIIIGSRSVTYTFGSRFTYKHWVRVLSKSEFQLSWAIIPILFVGSQSMSIEVRITTTSQKSKPHNHISSPNSMPTDQIRSLKSPLKYHINPNKPTNTKANKPIEST